MEPNGVSSIADDRCDARRERSMNALGEDSINPETGIGGALRQARKRQGAAREFRPFGAFLLAPLAPIGRSARSSAQLLAWMSVLAIAALSLVSGDQRPQSFLPGQAEHFVAYAAAGFFLAQGYPSPRHRIQAWIGMVIASGAFEILQHFVPGRSPSSLDALASASGLTLGLLLSAVTGAAISRVLRLAPEGEAREQRPFPLRRPD